MIIVFRVFEMLLRLSTDPELKDFQNQIDIIYNQIIRYFDGEEVTNHYIFRFFGYLKAIYYERLIAVSG